MKYAIVLAITGCADPIGHVKPDGGAGLATPVATAELPDGSYRTVIDSTSDEIWRNVDFATGLEAAPDTAWQLRTQRFHISTHAGVEVAPIAMPFASVDRVPAGATFVSDADTDADGAIDFAFDQGDDWYDYDAATHVLAPSALTWIARPTTAGSGPTFKLEILGYYDDAGTSGVFTFHWEHIAP